MALNWGFTPFPCRCISIFRPCLNSHFQKYLLQCKYFCKLKGGVWNQVWWNKYWQGGHTCWVNYHVEDAPHSKVLKTENYV